MKLLFYILLFLISCSPNLEKCNIVHGPDFVIERTEIEGHECSIYYGRHPQRAQYMNFYLDPRQHYGFLDLDTVPSNVLRFMTKATEFESRQEEEYNQANTYEQPIGEDDNIYLLKRDSLRVWLNVALEPGEFPAQVYLEDPHDTPGVFQKYYFNDLSLKDSTFLFDFVQEF